MAIDAQKGFYDQSKEELQPFITGGQGAYSTLNDLLGVGASGNANAMQSALENIPGYQFTRDQGLKTVQSGYAARGLADSGGALKGSANFATGLANSTFGTYANALQNSATTGANAASALAGYGTSTGQSIGQNIIGAGNAQAAGYNAAGQAVANAAGNVGQYYTLASIPGVLSPPQIQIPRRRTIRPWTGIMLTLTPSRWVKPCPDTSSYPISPNSQMF